jgi:DNA segregation ATPase FtsK/SpoIIIE-like protein
MHFHLNFALQDLIRHGKAHGSPATTSKSTADGGSESSASSDTRSAKSSTPKQHTPAPAQQQQQPAAQQQQEQIRQQAVAQNVVVPQLPSPDYRKEAEMIVQEERDSKNKMPTYKGLENYKLLDKMGE